MCLFDLSVVSMMLFNDLHLNSSIQDNARPYIPLFKTNLSCLLELSVLQIKTNFVEQKDKILIRRMPAKNEGLSKKS